MSVCIAICEELMRPMHINNTTLWSTALSNELVYVERTKDGVVSLHVVSKRKTVKVGKSLTPSPQK